jgi:hypothetical protein
MGGRDRVVEDLCRVGRALARREADEKVAAGCQHAMELREEAGEFVRRGVDDGPTRQYAAEHAVRDVQRGHRAHVETQAGVGLPGQLDHRGRGIDTEGLQPQLDEMSGDMPGSTAEVRDPTAPTRPRDLGEGAQDRAVQRTVPQRVAEQSRIGGGDGVVGLADGAEGVVFDHAGDTGPRLEGDRARSSTAREASARHG